MTRKAVVLLSGGLDSAVTLYTAKQQGYECHCLLLDYGQRHKRELISAKRIARAAGSKWTVIKLRFSWKGSSLLDINKDLPSDRTAKEILRNGIPSTYVPCRNTVFLSMAASFAEATGAETIFIGAHYDDSSGYPDCRKEYLNAFGQVLKLGTKAGGEGRLNLEFPLIDKNKKDIIMTGHKLGVPFELTWSCYSGKKKPCMRCDSCILRAKGFKAAALSDPLLGRYVRATPKADITEIFSSLQGEGIFVGVRQIFVRFRECNTECNFCDTPNRGPAREYSAGQLVREISALEKKNGPHHSVSLTGGEPLVYAEFLRKLLPSLKEVGLKAYLETNGTLPEELRKVIDLVDIVAMDFKLPSSTGNRAYWKEHLEFLKIASRKKVFIKVVVTPDTEKNDIEKAIALIKKVDSKIPFVIQPAEPLNNDDKMIPENRLREFSDVAAENDIKARVIPQMHKMLGLR